MRKVKWGVLGTAGIAEGQTIPGMQLADNCELYAIAGRNPEKAESFKTRFGFEKAYADYEALLEDPEVEAVYIPLPNTMHFEWAKKALEHKKHVLCEKPLTLTEEMAAELFATAEENGVYLMEAFAYLHSPFISVIRAELKSGIIGDIRFMDAKFLTSDYEGSNIRMRKETCGGCTYDLGVYTASLIYNFLEEEPEKVQAVATMDENRVDTFTSAVLEYASGKKAAFTVGMVMATDQDRRSDAFEIHGTTGSIRSKVFEFNGKDRLSYTVESYGGEVKQKVVEVPHNYALEVEQLGACILDGAKPAVTKEFSLANARLVDRVLKAIAY